MYASREEPRGDPGLGRQAPPPDGCHCHACIRKHGSESSTLPTVTSMASPTAYDDHAGRAIRAHHDDRGTRVVDDVAAVRVAVVVVSISVRARMVRHEGRPEAHRHAEARLRRERTATNQNQQTKHCKHAFHGILLPGSPREDPCQGRRRHPNRCVCNVFQEVAATRGRRLSVRP